MTSENEPSGPIAWLKALESRIKRKTGRDLSTRGGRISALLHYHFFDHAFLRFWWTNFAEVAPGVYRCNHPTAARVRRMKERYGIETILNLRGQSKAAADLFVRQAAYENGVDVVTCGLNARQAQDPWRYVNVLDTIEKLPRPFVMHCKSGADRTGLVSAFYLIAFEGKTVAEARAQLSWRFAHLRRSKAGVLDFILDAYEEEGEKQGRDLRSWLQEGYDPEKVTKTFQAFR